MKRLTGRIEGITGLKACYEGCNHPDNGCDCVRIRGALIKLSRYEDTGLTPEEIKSAFKRSGRQRKMTTEQAIKLMHVEMMCVERASDISHPCTRECEKCDLLQKDSDLIAAYGMAVDALRTQLGRKNHPKDAQK